jgi:hypothetical protein
MFIPVIYLFRINLKVEVFFNKKTGYSSYFFDKLFSCVKNKEWVQIWEQEEDIALLTPLTWTFQSQVSSVFMSVYLEVLYGFHQVTGRNFCQRLKLRLVTLSIIFETFLQAPINWEGK